VVQGLRGYSKCAITQRQLGHGPKENILAPQAIEFFTALQRRFTFDRREVLAARERRQQQFDLGHIPEPVFKKDHQSIVGPASGASGPDSGLGRVMLAVPPEREALLRAMASGANVLVADFEDCLSPTWKNCLEGHASLREALDDSVAFGRKGFDRNGVVVSVRPRTGALRRSISWWGAHRSLHRCLILD
jgi:malate synthase